jgi:hypothetical protein
VALALTGAAHAAEPAFDVRAEGSFPVQYLEAVNAAARQHTTSIAPYFGLSAIGRLQPDLSASIFATGGHGELGSLRDNDNTFVNFGGNVVKRWDALGAGVSIEHTRYFEGSFGEAGMIANEANVFVRYAWRPNPDLRITPSVVASVRADESLAVQRYQYSLRVAVEQRLTGSWWIVAAPRFRYYDYVGTEAGRHDNRFAIVGGLKYQVNESVDLMMLTGYENRASNIMARNSDRTFVGASLDFNISLLNPR